MASNTVSAATIAMLLNNADSSECAELKSALNEYLFDCHSNQGDSSDDETDAKDDNAIQETEEVEGKQAVLL